MSLNINDFFTTVFDHPLSAVVFFHGNKLVKPVPVDSFKNLLDFDTKLSGTTLVPDELTYSENAGIGLFSIKYIPTVSKIDLYKLRDKINHIVENTGKGLDTYVVVVLHNDVTHIIVDHNAGVALENLEFKNTTLRQIMCYIDVQLNTKPNEESIDHIPHWAVFKKCLTDYSILSEQYKIISCKYMMDYYYPMMPLGYSDASIPAIDYTKTDDGLPVKYLGFIYPTTPLPANTIGLVQMKEYLPTRNELHYMTQVLEDGVYVTLEDDIWHSVRILTVKDVKKRIYSPITTEQIDIYGESLKVVLLRRFVTIYEKHDPLKHLNKFKESNKGEAA